MHHGDDAILDAVAVTLPFSTDQHFNAFIGRFTRGEGVVTVHLLEGSPNPVNRNLPELGSHGFFHLCVIDSRHLGFQIGTNLEATLDAAVPLSPAATSAVSGKPWVPGVPVFIGSPKGLAAVAAWSCLCWRADRH